MPTDYLPKPFHNGEFLARVRALTRRGREYLPSILSCGNVTLDCSLFELRCGSCAVRLGSKEFQMLELLMRQQGRPISTEQLMERIWGYDSEAEINVVWAYISYLRRSWRRWAPTCALRFEGDRVIFWRTSHDRGPSAKNSLQ